jgi:hypothetical protein
MSTSPSPTEQPYTGEWKDGFFVCRNLLLPEGNQIFMLSPQSESGWIERLNAAFAAGQASRERQPIADELDELLKALVAVLPFASVHLLSKVEGTVCNDVINNTIAILAKYTPKP